jgi:hypothetical protein
MYVHILYPCLTRSGYRKIKIWIETAVKKALEKYHGDPDPPEPAAQADPSAADEEDEEEDEEDEDNEEDEEEEDNEEEEDGVHKGRIDISFFRRCSGE